jgi:hypothetical protein
MLKCPARLHTHEDVHSHIGHIDPGIPSSRDQLFNRPTLSCDPPDRFLHQVRLDTTRRESLLLPLQPALVVITSDGRIVLQTRVGRIQTARARLGDIAIVGSIIIAHILLDRYDAFAFPSILPPTCAGVDLKRSAL